MTLPSSEVNVKGSKRVLEIKGFVTGAEILEELKKKGKVAKKVYMNCGDNVVEVKKNDKVLANNSSNVEIFTDQTVKVEKPKIIKKTIQRKPAKK